jgi:hypothetical protein
MKNKNNNQNPYRNVSLDKIEAPAKKSKNEPKSALIKGQGDLRGGRK